MWPVKLFVPHISIVLAMLAMFVFPSHAWGIVEVSMAINLVWVIWIARQNGDD